MAIDMFLKIDGIPGESTDAKHKDEIDILSYTWGESLPAAPSTSSGMATAKVTMQDFHFAMRVNKASAQLFLACASASRLKNDVLTVRRSGAGTPEFLKWTLSDISVASYQTAADVPTGDAPIDQVNLRFMKIEVEYRPVKPDGSLDAPVNAGWDLSMNKQV